MADPFATMVFFSLLVGVFFAIANVVCVAILAWCYLSVKLEPKTLAVTGSARKAIVSDVVTWSATITAKDPELVKAYDALKLSSEKVKAFLTACSLPPNFVPSEDGLKGLRFKGFVKQKPDQNGNPRAEVDRCYAPRP